MASEELTRLSIDVPKDLHKLIKSATSFEKKSIMEFVVEAVRERLKVQVEAQKQGLKHQYRQLNELTRTTLQKADKGEDLYRYDSLDDFIAEMNAEEEE